jgi:hypothetical protein
MTDPDRKQLDDLAALAITVFSGLEQDTYFLAQTHAENVAVPPGLVAILTITLKHDQPLQRPLKRLRVPELVAV